MAKTGGRLTGHGLEVAEASSKQRKEQRMESSYPNVSLPQVTGSG